MNPERPPSSLSLLADRLQSSTLNDSDLPNASVSTAEIPTCLGKPEIWLQQQGPNLSFTHGAPHHRHSADIYRNFYGSNTLAGNAFIESSGFHLWEQSELDDYDNHFYDSNASSSCSPPKRQCRSLSAGHCLPRPIALRPRPQVDGKFLSSKSHCCYPHHHKPLRTLPNSRSLTSPCLKSRSAFTAPTYPTKSQHTTTSDYSLSPETDVDQLPVLTDHSCNNSSILNHYSCVPSGKHSSSNPNRHSVSFRPDSCSSGFHETPPISLAEAHSLPDCSDMLTLPMTSTASGNSSCSPSPPDTDSPEGQTLSRHPRCKSQPSFDPHACCCQCKPLVAAGLKRRIGQTLVQCECSRRQTQSSIPFGSSAPAAGSLPDRAQILRSTPSGQEVFFFGSNRSYLVSLPRIACSPRRSGAFSNTSNTSQSSNQNSGSASSGSSALTLTRQSLELSGRASGEKILEQTNCDSSDRMLSLDSKCNNLDDVNNQWNLPMDDSIDNDDYLMADRDPLDPPRIIEEAHPRVLAAAASAGFCFKPLNKALPPFQELDLELIEND